jgi:hypothetical protein
LIMTWVPFFTSPARIGKVREAPEAAIACLDENIPECVRRSLRCCRAAVVGSALNYDERLNIHPTRCAESGQPRS